MSDLITVWKRELPVLVSVPVARCLGLVDNQKISDEQFIAIISQSLAHCERELKLETAATN